MKCRFWSLALLVAASVFCQSTLFTMQGASATVPSEQFGGESLLTAYAPAASPETPALGSCCESGYCEDPCTSRTWFVEAESVFLSPTQHQRFGGITLGTQGMFSESNSSFIMTPRLTFGMQGERWGLLGRYWRLQTGDLEPQFVAGGSTFHDSYLRNETIDLEVTRQFTAGMTDLRLSAGVRYGQWKESASLAAKMLEGAGYYSGGMFASHDFSGTGLTLGLQGRRPVGCRNFHLFVDGRVSVLWDGNTSSCVATHATYIDSGQALGSLDQAIMGSDGNLFIGEIRVGGQWEAPLQCIPATAFLRLAFEYQYWSTNDAGEAGAFSTVAPAGGDAMLVVGSSTTDASMSLVGFTVGTGLNW